MEYDGFGNQTSMTLCVAANYITEFPYACESERSSQSDKFKQVVAYTYDDVGNVIKTTFDNGISTEYTYDKGS